MADLVLESCDLDCETKKCVHRTVGTGCHALVIRNGQIFNITLRFSHREYQEGVDKLALNVHTGPCVTEESDPKTHIPVSDALKEAAWSSIVSSNKEGALSMSVSFPPDARIGSYNLSLEASTGNQANSFQLGEFALLFNHWCPGEE
ncbi:protein-glutamine gamma-glutamyltransferase 2-like isoform X2 [Ascaphus truei]|uniref:protein-glutamine gamma-glutamyltransferase 2-like isoform X2 n=1 Tax=Ascaphus truei TaxID=8439 RepID=UPI003F599A3C